MPKYSVKIGEAHLTSDRPITAEDLQRAIKLLRKNDIGLLLTYDDLEIKLTVDGHRHGARVEPIG